MISIMNFSSNEPIKQFRRKNGLRKYAAKHGGVRLVGMEVKNGAFWLTVFFRNSTFARANFKSYGWMKEFVYNWKGATGAVLTINGSQSGICDKKNFSIM